MVFKSGGSSWLAAVDASARRGAPALAGPPAGHGVPGHRLGGHGRACWPATPRMSSRTPSSTPSTRASRSAASAPRRTTSSSWPSMTSPSAARTSAGRFRARLHARAIDRLRRGRREGDRLRRPVHRADDAGRRQRADRRRRRARATSCSRRPRSTSDGSHQVFGGADVRQGDRRARPRTRSVPNDPGGVLRRVAHDVQRARRASRSRRPRAAEAADHASRRSKPTSPALDRLRRARRARSTTVSFSTLIDGPRPGRRRGKDRVVVVARPPRRCRTSTRPRRPRRPDGGRRDPGQRDRHRSARASRWRRIARRLDVAADRAARTRRPRRGCAWAPCGPALIGAGGGRRCSPSASSSRSTPGRSSASSTRCSRWCSESSARSRWRIIFGAFERERVRDLFSRFVPEAVVDEVLARADDELRLGGVRRDRHGALQRHARLHHVLRDARPRTSSSSSSTRYLSAMSDVILDHGGTLIAYMGDGIMAVFGAPIEQADHADRAVAAAREMAGPALSRFNGMGAPSGLADGFRSASASTAARSCRATSGPIGGSSTRPSATRRTPPRASRR